MQALLKIAAEFAPAGHGAYTDPSNPGGLWMFHGTAPENVKSIRKKGLQPKKAVKHNLAYQGGIGSLRMGRTKQQKRSVHLTPHLDYASVYGQINRGGVFNRKSTPTVFASYHSAEEVIDGKGKLKQKGLEGSGARGFGLTGTAFLHEGGIPPEKLVQVPAHVLKPVVDDLEKKTPWGVPSSYKLAMLNRL